MTASRGSAPDGDRREAETGVVVIGGGITGLSAAHALLDGTPKAERPSRVLVLESSARLGGQIRTERHDDHLLEWGPDSLVTHKPAGAELCAKVGLGDELIYPNPHHAGIQVVHDGKLVDLPDGFMMMAPTQLGPLFRSPLFSWSGKLRIACEALLPGGNRTGGDETLASFVTRRFGREAFERAAEPIVAGLYTADADALSLQMTMPRFIAMEQQHGSVTRGLRRSLRMRRHGPKPPGFVALRHGLESLVTRLADKLPKGSVHTSAHVDQLTRDPRTGLWRVRVDGQLEFPARAVVLACPPFVSAKLLRSVDAELATELDAPNYASCATVNLIYKKADVRRALNRFGFFVPRTARMPVLGGSYVSVKFDGRVANDRVLLRAFLGGALHPGLLERSDQELVDLSDQTLRSLLHIEGRPVFSTTHRFPRSMPQFSVGQRDRVQRVAELAATHPGLVLGGGAVGAIGLPDSIRSGEQAARSVRRVIANVPRQLELAI